MDELKEWAAELGIDLELWVHEDNHRARNFYCRLSFVETGKSKPYELDESRSHVNMSLQPR
jgi:GNAT superfamily N-acetyltransferase